MKSEGGARKSFGERRGGKVGDPPSVNIKSEGGGQVSAKGGVERSGILPGSILRVREAQKSSGERRDGKVRGSPSQSGN